MRISSLHLALGLCAALVLAACGGGGSPAAGTAGATPTAAQAAVSSGTVTAFGSVFVNGHEFDTTAANVIDDDTGTTVQTTNTAAAAAGLTVGMQVDVKPTANSTTAAPRAAEIHVHPLVRGTLDYADATAATLSVMGQTVAVGTATVQDARACAAAAPATCTPIVDTTGFVSAASAGNTTCYKNGSTFTCSNQANALTVQVFGFLIPGSTNAPATVQASLVRVIDPGSTPVFRAEGALTAVVAAEPRFSLGNLSLTSTTACAGSTACAFAVNDVVLARGHSVAPVVTGGNTIQVAFTPDVLVARKASVLTAGKLVEVEGKVTAVNTTANSVVLQGLTVVLPAGTALPAVGDVLEVTGTVNADLSITATAVKTEYSQTQLNNVFAIADTLHANAVTGTAAPFTVAVLGVTSGAAVTIDANTRLYDRTAQGSSGAAFNINTFASYINALATPPSVVIEGYVDPTTHLLVASRLVIVPANNTVALFGAVTAASGSGANLTVAGLPVTSTVSGAGATAVTPQGHGTTATLAAIAIGDFILASGTETASGGVTAATIQDFGTNVGERALH